MSRVRCAAALNSAVGLVETENFGKEEVLDHRVCVEAETVGVDDLLEYLSVELFGVLSGMELELGIQAEAHADTSSSRDRRGHGIIRSERPACQPTQSSYVEEHASLAARRPAPSEIGLVERPFTGQS